MTSLLSLALTILMLLVSACATNPYAQFYKDNLQGQPLASIAILETAGEPKLYGTNDMDRDAKALLENGFVMIGSASFNATAASEEEALSQAREVGAAIVVVKTAYTDTVIGSLPVTMPNTSQSTTTFNAGGLKGTANTTTTGTSTVFVPYSMPRYDHLATFWVKGKPYVFGVGVRDLPVEVKQRLERNKGVIVQWVAKGSPAFEAGIIEGDALLKINDEDFTDERGSSEIVTKYAGQRVTLTLIRNGQKRLIPVTLGQK